MKKWHKILIAIFAVLVVIGGAGYGIYKKAVEPKVENALEKVQKVLEDEQVQSEVEKFVQELIDSGVLNESDIQGYLKYKTGKAPGEAQTGESTDGAESTQGTDASVKEENASDGTEKNTATGQTYNSKGNTDKTKDTSGNQKKSSDSSKGKSAGDVSGSGNNSASDSSKGKSAGNVSGNGKNAASDGKGNKGTEPFEPQPTKSAQANMPAAPAEVEEPTPAPKKKTLMERVKEAMSPDEFAFAMSIYSRIDTGYVLSNMNTNRAEVKEYVQRTLSGAEISRALEIYGKYSYLLSE